MALPREVLISLDTTPYYHCVSRCVRRAFLCGWDERAGQCFEHRRQWVEDKLLALSQVFALDVCAYAVMSNRYHVVLHINQARAAEWELLEVVQRWHQLCKGSALSQRFARHETLDTAELAKLIEVAEVWRTRLMDISLYMRMLNESIAREANREDGCTGRFSGFPFVRFVRSRRGHQEANPKGIDSGISSPKPDLFGPITCHPVLAVTARQHHALGIERLPGV